MKELSLMSLNIFIRPKKTFSKSILFEYVLHKSNIILIFASENKKN